MVVILLVVALVVLVCAIYLWRDVVAVHAGVSEVQQSLNALHVTLGVVSRRVETQDVGAAPSTVPPDQALDLHEQPALAAIHVALGAVRLHLQAQDVAVAALAKTSHEIGQQQQHHLERHLAAQSKIDELHATRGEVLRHLEAQDAVAAALVKKSHEIHQRQDRPILPPHGPVR